MYAIARGCGHFLRRRRWPAARQPYALHIAGELGTVDTVTRVNTPSG